MNTRSSTTDHPRFPAYTHIAMFCFCDSAHMCTADGFYVSLLPKEFIVPD